MICDTMVSVIIPIYNVSQYLEKCISSVIRQTYDRLQIILVNDGSTDHSGLICEIGRASCMERVFRAV